MADAPPAGSQGNGADPPPSYYKFIGFGLAITSGVFIGASFVLKKKGLLRSSAIAGEGHAYLRSTLWWTGMIMMIVGEICNFVAYSFAPALIVTPLGALSVVVCAVLSSVVLKEKLNLHGKIGCALCIVGAVVIVLHAPAQAAVTDIAEFKQFVLKPGFLVYLCLVLAASVFIIWKVAPKYGKNHLLVYISVCSMIGSLSVVATQGLGAAIVLNITTGTPQFNQWFIYVVLVFVVCTLITEINYLNKALNLFNTAMVTPVYYVFFTSATLVASVILFQGFSASPGSIMTVVMGFFVICAGVVLLQTSKAASHTEGLKKSKSTLSIHGNTFQDQDQDLDQSMSLDEKGDMDLDLELGPMGLRAVPFDAIRQMVRASTMPNSPFSVPSTPRGTGHEIYPSLDQTPSSGVPLSTHFLGRFRRPSQRGSSPSGTPIQGVIVVEEDRGSNSSGTSSKVARTLQPAALIPVGEKLKVDEMQGLARIPESGRSSPSRSATKSTQLEDDTPGTPLSSNTLTLRE